MGWKFFGGGWQNVSRVWGHKNFGGGVTKNFWGRMAQNFGARQQNLFGGKVAKNLGVAKFFLQEMRNDESPN